MTLRDKLIEIIRENTNLSIKNRIKFCDELEALYKKEMKKVIGEDENEMEITVESAQLWEETNNLIRARNALRRTQRGKANL